jgi:PTS system fructose-specific IIC component
VIEGQLGREGGLLVETCVLNLNAVDLKMQADSKQEALQKLYHLLYVDGAITSIEKFADDVQDREKKGWTGIGNGIAIPHGKSAAVVRSCIALARMKKPIPWETIDDQPVSLIILFVVGEEDRNTSFIRTIAQVARLLSQENFRNSLLNCGNLRKLARLFTQVTVFDKKTNLQFIAVTACPTGVAHTYIAKERLQQAALARGHSIKTETQGGLGLDDELTMEDIQTADVVIIAADIEIDRIDRFKNKLIVRVPISIAIKSPKLLFEKIEKKLEEKYDKNAQLISDDRISI